MKILAIDGGGIELGALAPGRVTRLQTELATASAALDDARPGNIAALEEEARKLIRDHAEAIDDLCQALTQ